MRFPETNTVIDHFGKGNFALSDVVANGRLVAELTEHPGWQIVTDILDQMAEDTLTVLSFGEHEHTQYAAAHGRVRGYKAAQSIADGVLVAAERAEDQLQELAAQTARGDDDNG